ncbi:MAG: hypothetical protein IIC57_09515, partial [Proteobacteria bacterium]|nr:hypothetical protein [Pseudomonadota bacterium]
GSFSGAMLAGAISPYVRTGAVRLHRAWASGPAGVVASALTFGLLLYHLAPFDFVTTSAELWSSLRQTRVRPGVHGIDSVQWVAWLGYAGQFICLGMISVLGMREKGLATRRAVWESPWHLMFIALVLEVSQIFVISPAPPSVARRMIGCSGNGTGAALALGERLAAT